MGGGYNAAKVLIPRDIAAGRTVHESALNNVYKTVIFVGNVYQSCLLEVDVLKNLTTFLRM